MLKTILISFLALAALATAVTFGLGPWLAQREAEAALARLEAAARNPGRQQGWEFRVPPPVKAWLVKCLPEKGPLPSRVFMEQTGTFKTEPKRPWMKFRAREMLTASPPGLVWDARLPVAPGVYVAGLDTLTNGRGNITGRLAGIYPLVDGDGPEVDLSNLTRWAAEAVWLPGALMPRSGLSWKPGPVEDSAVINLDLESPAGQGLGVSGVFYFGADHLPTRFVSHDRWQADGHGGYTRRAWQVTYQAWARQGPHLIPTLCRVSWLYPDASQHFAQIKVVKAEYR